MTPAQRKAAERQRKRDAGLLPLDMWVPAEVLADAKAAVLALVRDRVKDRATRDGSL